MTLAPEDVLNYWFYEVGQNRWFGEDRTLDAALREKFLPVYEQAIAEQLEEWKETPEGVLALLLLLNEFPRRMFRGTSRAFGTDEIAVELARDAIIRHFDDRIDKQFKLFFYLPFVNSESLGDQRLALYYIRERIKEDQWLTIAEEHLDIVSRFGRFPQRNPILGREPTPEEVAFLNQLAPSKSA
jgi:uncharacterized protein (DUF924 family)